MNLRLIFLYVFILLLTSCVDHHVEEPDLSDYPEAVAAIINNKCATAGCHNDISYANAGGIDLSTWGRLFDGGRSGSSVIPYSTDYSFLLYFVNTDSTRGPALLPTMPIGDAPLSLSEYQALYDWIQSGAPNKNGTVRYPPRAERKKIYTCMQGCDQVAVIDAESNNIMAYVSVGNDPGLIEAPHMIRVSPDGLYWYAVFYSGNVVQKFSTLDDRLLGTAQIGPADWNTIMITPDGTKGFVNGTNAGTTVVLDLVNMIELTRFSIDFPHGGFITPNGRWLYLTSQLGNFINKVDLSDPFYSYDAVILQPGEIKTTASRYDAHEIILSEDGNTYFVSCQTSDEVRAFRTSNDSLLAVIPVGDFPQEFAASSDYPYVYVTCTEDPISSSQKGTVYIINSTTLSVQQFIPTGYQPHGIAVDDDKNLVYVAHLNLDNNGPAPHHVSECGGRNGYITCIDERTLTLYRKSLPNGSTYLYRQEVLRAPYFVSYKR